MKFHFATATHPPKLRVPYAATLGWVAAAISVVLAVIHLFRIDTLLPIVGTLVPGGEAAAGWFVTGVILAEVFSIPFLLRMRLSIAAQVVSGWLATLAPLMWTLLTIWGLGVDASTGELGEFVVTKSSWGLIGLNLLWLGYNFITLWALGYNTIKLTPTVTPKKQNSKS